MGGRGSGGSRSGGATGVPSERPTQEQVLQDAKQLKGEELDRAITDLEWDGSWYREDKRQKRAFVEGVIRNNYYRDPIEGGDLIMDTVESNNKILSAVYGVSQYSPEFKRRFGSYDYDTLYSRRKR